MGACCAHNVLERYIDVVFHTKAPLVLYGVFFCLLARNTALMYCTQFGEGSVDRLVGGDQEDYEALQHTRVEQAHIQGAETLEAHPARKCSFVTPFNCKYWADISVQIISLSDVFISPLEDMYVSHITISLTYSHRVRSPATLSQSCSERICTVSSRRGHWRSNSSSISSTKYWCACPIVPRAKDASDASL